MARTRPKPRSNTASGFSSEGWIWVLVALVCAATLAVIGGYAYLRWSAEVNRVVLDLESLCPTDGERSVTVVLLDATDDLPSITKREVRSDLVDRAETLPVYGLLEMSLLDPSAPGGRRIMFRKCNPGDGANLSEWTANPRKARERWMEQFRKPLDGALDGTLKPAPAESSPIMMTIQDVAVARFGGRARQNIPKTFIIVSDMMEHTPEYSHYRGDLGYERFRGSAAYKKVHTDLHGAGVRLWYVQRLNPGLNSGKHLEFWAAWVRDNNGVLTQAKKLQGAN